MKITSRQRRSLKNHFEDEIATINTRLSFIAEQLRRQEDTASTEYRKLIPERIDLLWRRLNAHAQLIKLERGNL